MRPVTLLPKPYSTLPSSALVLLLRTVVPRFMSRGQFSDDYSSPPFFSHQSRLLDTHDIFRDGILAGYVTYLRHDYSMLLGLTKDPYP